MIARIDGSVGNAVAPQLHYEIKVNGTSYVDPLVVLKEHYAAEHSLLEKIWHYEEVLQQNILKRDILVKKYLQNQYK